MRNHWPTLIQEASRMPEAIGGEPDPALHLARETIRLARLAAALHLTAMAASPVTTPARCPAPAAARGDTP